MILASLCAVWHSVSQIFFFFIALGIVDEKGPLLSVSSQERETVKGREGVRTRRKNMVQGDMEWKRCQEMLKRRGNTRDGSIKGSVHPPRQWKYSSRGNS